MIVPILVVALIEASVYSNMKANAHLFHKLKTVQQQQKQMKNLLNAIPDSVFICTKEENDLHETRPLYANTQTKALFRRNMLAKSAEKVQSQKSKTDKIDGHVQMKKNPLDMQIFRALNQQEYFSVLEIIESV